MSQEDVLGYGYGLVVFLGGIVGYMKAGSSASLIAGTLFSLLISLSMYRLNVTQSRSLAPMVLTTGVLFVVMGLRFLRSGKLMPAGLVTILRWVYKLYYLQN